MEKKLALLQRWVEESTYTVFFGGAGVSTESGIPDFRGTDGLYHQKYAHPPETILSHAFFMAETEEFYRFYREKMLCLWAKPNAAHRKLAELERAGKLKAVITQNIDGLHQMAGSREVLELHGSVHRNYCMKCGTFYGVEKVEKGEGIPRCDCGGVVKPDVVLYGEGLDGDTVERSVRHIRNADLLLVGGTSLTVYPAAGLLQYYRGKRLVLINKGATAMDGDADLLLNGAIGEVLDGIKV